MEKTCRKCREVKPISEFPHGGYGKNNRKLHRPICKACVGLQVRIPQSKRREYEAKHPQPDIGGRFKCPICQLEIVVKSNRDVVLDHNHKTGKIRGWLCKNCNTSIGKLHDSIPTMLRAIAWIF